MVKNVLSHHTKRICWRSEIIFSWLRWSKARCFQTWCFLYKIKNKLWILIKLCGRIIARLTCILSLSWTPNCYTIASTWHLHWNGVFVSNVQNKIFLEDTHKVLSGGGVDTINSNTCLTLKRGTISKPRFVISFDIQLIKI